jgi:hypothetical protein
MRSGRFDDRGALIEGLIAADDLAIARRDNLMRGGT